MPAKSLRRQMNQPCDQMEAWLVKHPHAGPVVNSPEELQAQLPTALTKAAGFDPARLEVLNVTAA